MPEDSPKPPLSDVIGPTDQLERVLLEKIKAAEEFVRPLTFAAITGHKVISSLWGEDAGASDGEMSGIEHINEAQTTAALIVVPATADILAKFAHGIADDFLVPSGTH